MFLVIKMICAINASVVHLLKPHTCAEIKHAIHIASANDELNLNCLEERLFQYADLSWFSRHTHHATGQYNNNEQYMIHQVYICGNLNSPFVVQNCDRLEG